MTVKAYNSGLFIGFVYNEGKWVNGEPRTGMNQSAAVSADALRTAVATIFARKGEAVVEANLKAFDKGAEASK